MKWEDKPHLNNADCEQIYKEDYRPGTPDPGDQSVWATERRKTLKAFEGRLRGWWNMKYKEVMGAS